MKSLSEADFEAILKKAQIGQNGIRVEGSYNLSGVSNIPANLWFTEKCIFSRTTKIGGFCHFAPYSEFESDIHFGQQCVIGDHSKLGSSIYASAGCSFFSSCRFGENSRFDEHCTFGPLSRFDEHCTFGKRCEFGVETTFCAGAIFYGECRFANSTIWPLDMTVVGDMILDNNLRTTGEEPIMHVPYPNSSKGYIVVINTADGVVVRRDNNGLRNIGEFCKSLIWEDGVYGKVFCKALKMLIKSRWHTRFGKFTLMGRFAQWFPCYDLSGDE